MSKTGGKDGLTVANYIAITLSQEKRGKHNIAADFLVLITGLVGSLYAGISSFEIPVDGRLLIITLFVISLAYYGIESLKKGKRYILPAFFLLQMFLGWKAFFYIENGFYYIENMVIKKAAKYYGFTPVSFVAMGDVKICTAAFFLVAGIILAFFLVTAIRFQLFRGAFYLLEAAFLASGFLVGVIPHPVSLICSFLSVYMLQVMDMIPTGRKAFYPGEGKKRREIREEYKRQIRRNAALLVAGIFLVLLVTVSIFFPKMKYDEIEPRIRQTKHELQERMTAFFEEGGFQTVKNVVDKIDWRNFQLFSVEKAGGGVSGGNLGQADGISYTGETALLVTVPEMSGTIYLKAFAGAIYDGDSWNGLSDEKKRQYQELRDAFGGEFNGENLSETLYNWKENTGIKDKREEKEITADQVLFFRYPIHVIYALANQNYLYLPYVVDSNLQFSYGMEEDLYRVPRQKQQMYQADYREASSYQNILDSMKQDDVDLNYFWDFEKEYRDFVYETYLEMPKEGLSRLKALDLGVSYSDGSIESNIEIIRAVRDYLSKNTLYSLTPGSLPEGEDFVENFLFDTKKGYCMHYASAAVLLLRNYGVPARYVEGYVVTKGDITSGWDAGYEKVETYLKDGSILSQDVLMKQVEVTDERAHAWVEVYEDGYGWVPVEVTSGYMEENENVWEEKRAELTNAPEELLEEATEEIDIKQEDSIEQGEEGQTEGQIEDVLPKEENKTAITEEQKSDLHIFIKIFGIATGVAGVVVILLIRRNRIIARRKAMIERHDNEAVLFLYGWIVRMTDELSKREQKAMVRKARRKKKTGKKQEKNRELLEGMEEVERIALKARFSNLEVTEEEYQIVYHHYLLLRVRFRENASNIAKIYIDFIKVL